MPPLTEPVLAPGSLARMPQPVLAVDGLVLRPWQRSDVPALSAAYAEPDIQQWHARSMDDREAEEWIDSRGRRWEQESGADWAIAERSSVIGRIALKRIGLAEGSGEVSYWVLPAARGRGVAAQAVNALSDWAFGRLGLHRIELLHSTVNAASCRVAELTGYSLEGIKRSEALHPDGWHDMHLHARLAEDQPTNSKRLPHGSTA